MMEERYEFTQWVAHTGDCMPVPAQTLVQPLRLTDVRGGYIAEIERADCWFGWTASADNSLRILAYRIARHKPAAPDLAAELIRVRQERDELREALVAIRDLNMAEKAFEALQAKGIARATLAKWGA